MLHWAVVLLLLGTGCASTHKLRLETGQGRALEHESPTWDRSVEVSEVAFEDALQRLVLEAPLAIRPRETGLLVRTSSRGAAMDQGLKAWQAALGRDYRGWCRAYQPHADCLSLLEDGLGFSSMDRLALALGLALALDPMRESITEVIEETLTPRFFHVAVLATMGSWVALAANPEPVFTKTAAVLAMALVAYLGGKTFLALVRACFELKRASDSATTFEEDAPGV